MKTEYYDIYNDLYDFYRAIWAYPIFKRPPISEFYPLYNRHAIRFATEAIEYAISSLQLVDKIRPDAKHFLLVNLHQLVVLPLKHPLYSEEKDNKYIREMLVSDVILILKEAINSENEGKHYNRDKPEISGGNIIRTISRVWDQLKLNDLDVWG